MVTDETAELSARVAEQATWSEWAPDGRLIVYGGADGGVLVAPRDGAAPPRAIVQAT